MPHIHTAVGQLDFTVSAYILRQEKGSWKCMLHAHRKFQTLMQIGGHVELSQQPWEAMAAEVLEESGYSLDELEVLQWQEPPTLDSAAVIHPIPFSMNTHDVGDDHYHIDISYAFVATDLPRQVVGKDESEDIRWLTLEESQALVTSGEALRDTISLYEYLLRHLETLHKVPATSFSIEKPAATTVSYKVGKASDSRT